MNSIVLFSVINLMTSVECALTSVEGALTSDLGEVVLTPWWTMRMSVGESITIDCGVATNGTSVTITWLKSQDSQPIRPYDESTNER